MPEKKLGRREKEGETELSDRKNAKIVNLVVSIISAIGGALAAYFGVPIQ